MVSGKIFFRDKSLFISFRTSLYVNEFYTWTVVFTTSLSA
jgi:hypothetical protein